jgi:hypothetical protein
MGGNIVQQKGRSIASFRRTLALLLVFSFCSIAFQPCFTSVAQAGLPSSFLTREKNKDSFEAICNLISSNGTREVRTNISTADITLLNDLYEHDQHAFLEKARALGLFGNVTMSEIMDIIDQEGTSTTAQNTTGVTNLNCRVKFSGSLFQTYYFPLPYVVYRFMINFGLPILTFFAAMIFLLGLTLAIAFPELTNLLLNFLSKLATFLLKLLTPLIAVGQKAISILGWIHAWSPVKFPIRNTVVTSGNFHLEAWGDQGYWNNTGTTTIILMGFRGLWISLPPVSNPPYTPTWCIGHARLVNLGGLW